MTVTPVRQSELKTVYI